jgi:hypothetical protein
MITAGNEKPAGRRVEFDSIWNDADRRSEKVTPASVTSALSESERRPEARCRRRLGLDRPGTA